ncbi:hypothetical protein F4778DRAFT_762473 [Xylariomycetidae sp. FL2044]|nr:hypothetical protein F4778DRAFT_762473 [Xylariomycetidae sp. FL2044]
MHTTSFDQLPAEIKQDIWQRALPDDEPEVCIVWPLRDAQLRVGQLAEPMVVDTAFPVLIHVCREWRYFVLDPLRPRVKFRFSPQAGCMVPYRDVRFDIDALYLSIFNHPMATDSFADSDPEIKFATLNKVRHLALDWVAWSCASNWLPQLIFRGTKDLVKLSVVFPSSRKPIWEWFQAPARRCKLRSVEAPNELQGQIESLINEGRGHLEFEAPFAWQSEMDFHTLTLKEHCSDWFVGSAWDKENEKMCFENEAAAFICYARADDGHETWVEGCEERLLGPSRSQNPPVPEQRPHPGEFRVNDLDDYQY